MNPVSPLSFAQQRLWFIEQLQPGSSLYNLPDVWRISGPLDFDALERSVNEVVRRQASLRTVFRVDEGGAGQCVRPFQSFSVPLTDLSGAADAEAEAKRWIEREIRAPFALETGPLFRARLLRLSATEHFAVFNAHHIVWDGWSIELFRSELAACYEALQNGRVPAQTDLAVQYTDFAVWQRDEARGPVWEEQLKYWKEQLGGPLPVLELPMDRPRPVNPTFAGATQFVSFDRELTDALRALNRKHGVTMFMTLLAAFKVLLQRHTRQEDVLVGSPIAGRNRADTEGLIGFFVNTLVLRTDLSGDPEFAELLRRVRKTTLDAYAHDDMPFERVVQELQPERSLSRNPVFQVMFGYERVQAEDWNLAGATARMVNVDLGTAKFDWTLLVQESEQGLQAALEFSTEMFDVRTIERLLGRFRMLLSGIVADPHCRISQLPMLTPEEEQRVVVEFNRTDADHDRTLCAHQLFETQAERTPAAVALIDGGAEISYAELNHRANTLARRLMDLGVGPDVRVGLCVERSAAFAVSVLAILKAGGAYVPIDAGYPQERVMQMLEVAQPMVVLAGQKFLSALPAGTRVICLEGEKAREGEPLNGATRIVRNGDGPTANAVEAENLAYVIFTSGSTGVPKGVAMPHGPLVNLIGWQLQNFSGSRSARTLQFASPGFDVSFQELFSTWAAGGTLIIAPEDLRRDPARLWHFIEEQRVERIFLPFVALQQLAEAAADIARLPGCLREIITAGEALRVTPQLIDLFRRLTGCVLTNQYGPSETHVVTAHVLSGNPESWPALPPIGKPIWNTRIYLLDARLQPVPIGVPGELYVGGESLARGYLNRPEWTGEKFVKVEGAGLRADVPTSNAQRSTSNVQRLDRMYRTGDLARWREDGVLEFLGRADCQVKIRGYRVEPGEVESVLQRLEWVQEAVVAPHTRKDGSRELVAYVVSRGSNGADHTSISIGTELGGRETRASEVRRFLGQYLPEYMIPAHFVPLDALPLTASGKVNRLALPSPEPASRVHDQAPVPPRNAAERLIAQIWSETLERPEVGIHDNFFQLGGHSLIATRVISRMASAFQVDLPVRVIFEIPTIAALSERIASLPRITAAASDRIGRRMQPTEAQALLSRLEELSEAEIESLLQVTGMRTA